MAAWVALVAVGCDGSDDVGATGANTDSQRQLLTNLVDGVLTPNLEAFDAAASALDVACGDWQASPDDAAAYADARGAWLQAMAAWQRVDVLQLGPLAQEDDEVPGSEGLRNQIYAWPKTSLCAIDQALVAGDYDAAGAFAEELLPNVRGLSTLEYLLFVDSDHSACPASAELVKSGDWDAAVKQGLAPKRAAYAAAAAKDVLAQSERLDDAWRAYARDLKTAGDGSGLFETSEDGLNAVVGALLYLDTQTKDKKLGVPTAQSEGCPSDACPEFVEHPHAPFSREAIAANLVAFESTFHGDCAKGEGEPCGWSDLLREEDAAALAKEIEKAISEARAAVNAIEPGLAAAIEADDPEPADAFDAVQRVTTLFKADFMAALKLSPPTSGPGDND